ncbi:ABC transporter ATP-binding protein [Streptomyces sp. NBC_00690]|uniref:ABC transporter ATP-binding protein n=1 Tax=Streptomyces sp. NBC_00690 TaxID=2975808 RepID=UPI002E291A1A|nr:ABC transporter ATP-binding protein [Streptomyces sp. NBC_00690]
MTDRQKSSKPPRVDPRVFHELTADSRGLLRSALSLQALSAVLSLLPYVGLWLIADEALGSGRTEPIVFGVLLIAASAVAALLLRLSAYALSHRADLRVQRSVRNRVASHLARLPLGWFTAGSGGRTLETLQGDVEELHAAVAHGRMEVVAAVVTPSIAVGWLVTVDWRLTLLVILPSTVVHFQQRHLLSGAGERQRGVMVALSSLVDAITQLVRDLPTLRVVRRGDGAGTMVAASDRFRAAQTSAYVRENRRTVRNGALVDPVTTMALVLGAGGAMVAAGWLSAPDLLPFALVAVAVSSPLQDIATARAGMRTAHLAAERIGRLLDTPALPEPELDRHPAGRDVVLRDVTFGYQPDEPVLHQVSLELRPGTITALVGPSGSGKSTVAALLARFYDTDEGQVLIGGVDVREMTTSTLYRHMGFVLQDAQLIRTSLRDNIRLAKPDATDSEVIAAAKAARIHDRIEALPQGYDAIAGQDATLSGGERQRIAIARVLLADPDVLVLDEATAGIDPETEAEVQSALAVLAEGRTVLVIAHRPATVTEVDQIVVLDQGRVAQIGRHEELIAVAGVYRQMWNAYRSKEHVA